MTLGPIQGGDPVNRVASSGSSGNEKLDQIYTQLGEIQKQLLHTKFYGASPGQLDALENQLRKLTSEFGNALTEIKNPMDLGDMAQIQFTMNKIEDLNSEIAEQILQPMKDMINKIKA